VVTIDLLLLERLKVLPLFHPHNLHQTLLDLNPQFLLLLQIHDVNILFIQIFGIVNWHHLLFVFNKQVRFVIEVASDRLQVFIDDCYVHGRIAFDVLVVQVLLDSKFACRIIHLLL